MVTEQLQKLQYAHHLLIMQHKQLQEQYATRTSCCNQVETIINNALALDAISYVSHLPSALSHMPHARAPASSSSSSVLSSHSHVDYPATFANSSGGDSTMNCKNDDE